MDAASAREYQTLVTRLADLDTHRRFVIARMVALRSGSDTTSVSHVRGAAAFVDPIELARDLDTGSG